MSTKQKRVVDAIERELGPTSFAGFIRGARASKDLSQVDMAKKLGMSRSTLCDIEKGRHLVSPGLAASIAKACGLSVKIAVLASLQDQLRKSNLKMTVVLVA